MDNLPWRLAGTRGRIAAAGSIGNVVLGTILCAALLAACKMIIGPGTITALGSLIPVRRSAGRLLGRVDDHATLSATSRQDWGRPRTSSRAPSSRSHSLWGRSSSGYYVIADHLLH